MITPKGGRGVAASKPTIMRRIPQGIEETVVWLSDKFRAEEWDGTKEGLVNLISSFEAHSKEGDNSAVLKGLKLILQRADNYQIGYTTKSFARGLKALRRLVE